MSNWKRKSSVLVKEVQPELKTSVYTQSRRVFKLKHGSLFEIVRAVCDTNRHLRVQRGLYHHRDHITTCLEWLSVYLKKTYYSRKAFQPFNKSCTNMILYAQSYLMSVGGLREPEESARGVNDLHVYTNQFSALKREIHCISSLGTWISHFYFITN